MGTTDAKVNIEEHGGSYVINDAGERVLVTRGDTAAKVNGRDDPEPDPALMKRPASKAPTVDAQKPAADTPPKS